MRLSWAVLLGVIAAALLPERVWMLFSGGHSLVRGEPDLKGSVALAWLARYEGGGYGITRPSAVAFSHDGETLFVTGAASERGGRYRLATIAYDFATGKVLWTARDPARNDPRASRGLRICPSGDRLFVAGWRGERGPYAYALVVYSLPGGRRLWEAAFPAYPGVFAFDTAPGACGERVYVAGIAASNDGAPEAVLIARHATTGAELWRSFREIPSGAAVSGTRLATASGGTTVVAAELLSGGAATAAWRIAAFDAENGGGRWERRHPLTGPYEVRALTAGPEGGGVYVAGTAYGKGSESQGAAILALDVGTGQVLWSDDYPGLHRSAHAVAVDPETGRVFVAGGGFGGMERDEPVGRIVSYRAGTGEVVWSRETCVFLRGTALALSSEGGSLIVGGPRGAGARQPVAAVYDLETGTERWIARYAATGSAGGIALAVAVTPDGSGAAVTGISTRPDGRAAYSTAMLHDRPIEEE